MQVGPTGSRWKELEEQKRMRSKREREEGQKQSKLVHLPE